MLTASKRFLERRSQWEIIALGLALLALVGAEDFLSGYELSFSIFYLVPVVLVTWFASQTAGFLFCGASAVVWFLVDRSTGHPYSNQLFPVWNASVRLGFFSVTTHLLGELKANLKRQETRATTDGLTGVLNARAFGEISDRMLKAAARHSRPVALAYLDVDGFKGVNDGSGHAEGDRVLTTLANTLAGAVRGSDVLGRVGGDEFAILLTETDYAGAKVVLGRIREKLIGNATDSGWAIGFSIGVAVFPVAPSTVAEGLNTADRLMYRAKKAGKNNIIYEEQVG